MAKTCPPDYRLKVRMLPDRDVSPDLLHSAHEAFEKWFRVNHPWDWWACDRKGEPLPQGDRLLVWEIARAAFLAGMETQNSLAQVGDWSPHA